MSTTNSTEHVNEELRENLADLAHEQWSGWMRYMFEKCGVLNDDGSFTITAPSVERWHRQMQTPYAQLSEPEKESDRIEADKFLAAFDADEKRVADIETTARKLIDSLDQHYCVWDSGHDGSEEVAIKSLLWDSRDLRDALGLPDSIVAVAVMRTKMKEQELL